jgi:hypothetical protein
VLISLPLPIKGKYSNLTALNTYNHTYQGKASAYISDLQKIIAYPCWVLLVSEGSGLP